MFEKKVTQTLPTPSSSTTAHSEPTAEQSLTNEINGMTYFIIKYIIMELTFPKNIFIYVYMYEKKKAKPSNRRLTNQRNNLPTNEINSMISSIAKYIIIT